eukprot:10254029-Lingulodinium_polyedra.AAC.1
MSWTGAFASESLWVFSTFAGRRSCSNLLSCPRTAVEAAAFTMCAEEVCSPPSCMTLAAQLLVVAGWCVSGWVWGLCGL